MWIEAFKMLSLIVVAWFAVIGWALFRPAPPPTS